jgi:hypothetical protein
MFVTIGVSEPRPSLPTERGQRKWICAFVFRWSTQDISQQFYDRPNKNDKVVLRIFDSRKEAEQYSQNAIKEWQQQRFRSRKEAERYFLGRLCAPALA